MAAHNEAYAKTVSDLLRLGAGNLVVEVASNDGSLLRCFQAHGVDTLGIEPASNIAAGANESGVETINEFFDSDVAQRVRASRPGAKVVAANNVLAHVDDPVDFLRGCRTLLADDGLIEAFTVDAATGFALAVQWHPEWKATENAFSLEIFKAFGDACRERATTRQVRNV